MEKVFKGIIPALYTCFEDDGSVNYSETVKLAKALVGKGVGGFYLCGSTGNGLLLSVEERKKIVEAISNEFNGQIPLMIHVGCMATKDAVALAKHAAGLKGIKAISSLPPQYYPISLAEEICNLSEIASATDLPFYPYLFGSTIEKYDIENFICQLKKIPNMAGLKVFVSDLAIHRIIMEAAPDWEIIHGYDQSLVYALCMPGIDSAIGSTYNVVPEIVIEIFETAKKGNLQGAIDLQVEYDKYWLSIMGNNFLAFGRYFLTKQGFKMGKPRQPLCFPDAEAIKNVEQKMKDFGFNLGE